MVHIGKMPSKAHLLLSLTLLSISCGSSVATEDSDAGTKPFVSALPDVHSEEPLEPESSSDEPDVWVQENRNIGEDEHDTSSPDSVTPDLAGDVWRESADITDMEAPDTFSPILPVCSPETTSTTLNQQGEFVVTIHGEPNSQCAIEVIAKGNEVISVEAPSEVSLSLGEWSEDEPGWIAPRKLSPGIHSLMISFGASELEEEEIRFFHYGSSPEQIDREKSLVWTQESIVNAPQSCGLPCLMEHISDDGHGGALLQQWFTRFATTAHSERLGPLQMLLATFPDNGVPPSQWELDNLPFSITGIHNRLDLAEDNHCGELRVSVASEDPVLKPFHLIFVFHHPPRPHDSNPSGSLHCTETAMAWAQLSNLEEEELPGKALSMMEQVLTGENFSIAESVEFVVAPWEWRQWFLEPNPDPDDHDAPTLIFENRPLFQTVDLERLNSPGPDREAFLTWVGENAEELDQRRALIPETFRAFSARLNQGVPWKPLDLSGLDPALIDTYPDLRQNIEMMGCPGCHSADAEFVQTLPDGTFSPFYDAELDARSARLMEMISGKVGIPPFGPLQEDPVFHP